MAESKRDITLSRRLPSIFDKFHPTYVQTKHSKSRPRPIGILERGYTMKTRWALHRIKLAINQALGIATHLLLECSIWLCSELAALAQTNFISLIFTTEQSMAALSCTSILIKRFLIPNPWRYEWNNSKHLFCGAPLVRDIIRFASAHSAYACRKQKNQTQETTAKFENSGSKQSNNTRTIDRRQLF